MDFQYTDKEQKVEHVVEIDRGLATRIHIFYPMDKTLSVVPSEAVTLEPINDEAQKPQQLGEGVDAKVFDVCLNAKTGILSVSKEGVDGSVEQPPLVITFNELPKKMSDSAAKGKDTKDKNAKKLQKICEHVESMMDTEVADQAAQEINIRNAVTVGAAATLIKGIEERHPKLDFVHLYGNEHLIYLLPGGSGTSPERKLLRQLYDIVAVAAGENYPDLKIPDRAGVALIQRCCHLIYLGEKPKVDRAAKAEEAAKAREAKKEDERKAHEAFLAGMTPEARAKYNDAEAAKAAAQAAAKKEREAARRAEKKARDKKAAETHEEKVVAGVNTMAQLWATNTEPLTLTGTSYEISIKEDGMSALHDLILQGVSTRLTIKHMVDGFGPLCDNMEHNYTLHYFKHVLLNKCKTSAKKAGKNPDAPANDFFKDWLAFVLVRLVGNNWKDTCHTENTTGVLRVPAVSEGHLEEFMKWSPEDMENWGKKMEDPAFMLNQLEKTPLHPQMKAIFDNVSKYMVKPVMTEEILDTWNKNNKMFEARTLKESVSRSYQLEKAKAFKVSGPADLLSPFGVFDQDESDVKTSRTKMKRAETVFENAPANTDETKRDKLKRAYETAFAEHKAAVERLAQKRSMGLKDFVDRKKVGPEHE